MWDVSTLIVERNLLHALFCNLRDQKEKGAGSILEIREFFEGWEDSGFFDV